MLCCADKCTGTILRLWTTSRMIKWERDCWPDVLSIDWLAIESGPASVYCRGSAVYYVAGVKA